VTVLRVIPVAGLQGMLVEPPKLPDAVAVAPEPPPPENVTVGALA
jgi:hypothetical protein